MDDTRLILCTKIQRKALLAFHDLSAVVDQIDVLEAGFSCRHAAPTHTHTHTHTRTQHHVGGIPMRRCGLMMSMIFFCFLS